MDQIRVDGPLPHSGRRGCCRDDVRKGYVEGRQLPALKKGRGQHNSSYG